jgi:tRNA dimethylallyltransferase
MTEKTRPAVVCIVGPTAAGKTEIAVELVRRYPFSIVSVDSAMVYRHLDIGTAKPDSAVLKNAPHRLINIRDPWERYSAGDFLVDARREIDAIHEAGRIPLLVGGTLLYFSVLEKGLAPLPTADTEIRRALDERGAAEGWKALHTELAEVDPAAANRIEPTDRQRIQRALEVYLLTGETISELQRAEVARPNLDFLHIALEPGDRKKLHERIETRFANMMAAGFLDEVAGLREMPELDRDSQAMRAVGYRQLWEHLDGRIDEAEAVRNAITATRRLAKRQLTWMRAESRSPAIDCLSPQAAERVVEFIDARAGDLFDSL